MWHKSLVLLTSHIEGSKFRLWCFSSFCRFSWSNIISIVWLTFKYILTFKTESFVKLFSLLFRIHCLLLVSAFYAVMFASCWFHELTNQRFDQSKYKRTSHFPCFSRVGFIWTLKWLPLTEACLIKSNLFKPLFVRNVWNVRHRTFNL